MGNSIKITKTKEITKTFKCPMVFETMGDIQLLLAYGIALKDTINWVLGIIAEHLFDKLEVVCGDNRSIITLWDLYKGFRVSDAPTINGKPANKCIGSSAYITREIMREKTSAIGITTLDVVHHMEDAIEGAYNTRLTVDKTLIEECVFNRVNAMMLNFVAKKLNAVAGNAKRDRTWENVCREVTKNLCTNDIDARKMAYQMEKIGVYLSPILTGEMPDAPKWNEKYSIKIGKYEKMPVSAPDMGNDTLIAAYLASIEKFMEVVQAKHPVLGKNSLISVPSASFDSSSRDVTNYYDIPGVLNGVPSYDKKHKVKVHVRMQSGHSSKYYPDNLDGLAEKAKISFRLPDNCMPGDGTKYVTIDAMAHIPVKVQENETAFTDDPSIEDGIGIDLNEASFFMNTTIPMNQIKGGIDWIEAIQAFYKENPKAWMFSDRAPTRTRSELLSLANRAD